MTRIVLRPIGSPMPLGFFTVAIDSSAGQRAAVGPATRGIDRQAVTLIVFAAYVVQVIVGIFAFHGRDSIAATLMMSFAITWLVDALIFYTNPPGATAATRHLLCRVLAGSEPRSCWPARFPNAPWPRCWRWPCREA